MKKQNNAGFSLVELIVTILIMSILTAGVVVSVAAMHRADSDKEANKIASVLEKGRMTVLSKTEDTYVKLYVDGEGNACISMMQGGMATLTEQLDDDATIAYKTKGGVKTTLATGTEVNICFSKSSGAFKASPEGYFVEYIKVTADKDLYVCLVADTGRCYIDTTY